MSSLLRAPILAIATALLLHGLLATAGAQPSFIEFESGPVRPVALSPDGTKLFAVNTPDNTLEVFSVAPGGITHTGSIPVGMEPVTVAARTNTEVWVVNYLSDSVSIVDVSGAGRVIRTLLVGDEPSDLVFAGLGGNRAFITTAHRGQNAPTPRGDFSTPGIGRADVWVFDVTNLGLTLGGTPQTIVTLFGDKPRALAVSPDGTSVYAAILHSGNQTTAVLETLVCDTNGTNLTNNTVQGACTIGGQSMPGGIPLPHRNSQGFVRPETGLILKLNRNGISPGIWQDELGRNWNNAVKFTLPDLDVFKLDATANPPIQVDSFAHVGTVLFNMVTNPITGKLYVSNTDARNEVRFEGPGTLAAGVKPIGEPATVRGHLAESRITVIDPTLDTVTPRHLNKHINYAAVPQPVGTKEKSLATPVGMDMSADGSTLYVAAYGSSAIGVFDAAALEADTFVPDATKHIKLNAGGPAGVVVRGNRLYTLTRFNNAVAVVDLTLGTVGQQTQSVPLHNPEPASVVEGRPFLYDAGMTGSNGEAACASCHIFGDLDSLGWDLGNPDDIRVNNGNPFTLGAGAPFHPQKGPMTTQSLRGLANMGPQHWRGDRQGNEVQAFNAFNVAFPGLVGRDEGQFSAATMQKFTDFALQIVYPPNPIRQLDDTLRVDEQAGFTRYFGAATDGGRNCNGCHTLDPSEGHFGGDGQSSIEGETQEFKVPHMRNTYQKVGMFGMANVPGLDGSFTPTGNQVRGFGLLHDGSIDTVKRFLNPATFSLTPTERDNLQALIMAFGTDLPPMMGQQITRTATNGAVVDPRITAMITAASAPYVSKLLGPGATQCDVVVKGVFGGVARGYLLNPGTGLFESDRVSEAPVNDATLRARANTGGQELTYTCAPFGSGRRMGIDRDLDTHLDRDERDAGSDPADPLSIPGATSGVAISAKKLQIRNKLPDDETRNKIVLVARAANIISPSPGTPEDPRCGVSPIGTVKATLTFSSATSGQSHTTDLPCQNWTLIGNVTNPRGYKYSDRALDDGTAKTITWKGGSQLKATLLGKGPTTLGYDLQIGISQGTVSAVFGFGNTAFCVSCVDFKGRNGSDAKTFLGRDCLAPPVCVVP